MKQTWKQIQEGYGLSKVPMQYTKEIGCCMCHGKFPTRHLWSSDPVTYDGSLKGLQRMLDRLRSNCYCKDHAISYYGDPE